MTHHFDWSEVRDFGSLYTQGDWLMPPNAAQTMLDCYPQSGGGLRAFIKFNERTTSGIGTGERFLAYYVRSGIPVRSGAAVEASDFYLVTFKSADNACRLYRFDETNDTTPPTSWTLLKTFLAGVAFAGHMTFASYQVSGTVHVYLALQHATADEGIWRIRYSDGVVTKVSTETLPHGIITHQDRLLFSTGAAQGSRLRWNDPNTETFAAANFLDPLPFYYLTSNSWHRSFIGELLVAKDGAPIVLVQDNITDPEVRIMQEARPSMEAQSVAEAEEGIIYQTYKDGVYLTRTGAETVLLSEPLSAGDVTRLQGGYDLKDGNSSLGEPVYAGHWWFGPMGFIWDSRTKKWFKTSFWGAAGKGLGKHQAYDRHVDRVNIHIATAIEETGGANPPKLLNSALDETQFSRMSTYTWESAPLRHPSGRQIVLREVQVPYKPYASGASIVCEARTVDGTLLATRTKSGLDNVPGKVSFLFNHPSEILDVTIKPNSNNVNVEAPSIEAVRIGTLAGRMTDH